MNLAEAKEELRITRERSDAAWEEYQKAEAANKPLHEAWCKLFRRSEDLETFIKMSEQNENNQSA